MVELLRAVGALAQDGVAFKTIWSRLTLFSLSSHPPTHALTHPRGDGLMPTVVRLDVELILQCVDGTEDDRNWRLVLRALSPRLLLQLAIADGAIFGYDTLADLRQQAIPAGEDEMILRFKDAALDQPILWKCTRTGGVTTDPMPKSAFLAIFKSTLVNAGYFWSLSIHAIRRMLGKGRHTAVERSQHLTQADLLLSPPATPLAYD
ncbi:hypothetical protein Z517_10487 [Fonsecaea pedrosoi CBS 271.37]|uniref:Uncharacterized protein n=1 Tax=Fonsecaea pedrosoi CBS 271.37 TaxID=1442368 RepID=A0A0D2GTH7_9EURO|nr:uncharacterized protein Z517_10487 [Fonsecaea pedrosoi CBS 271.37]KIW75744.1 hypothetical protein Z517_10487 [Fonsecaea pedrosoi CBS 271.37]